MINLKGKWLTSLIATVLGQGLAFIAGMAVVLTLCGSPQSDKQPQEAPYKPPQAPILEKVGKTTVKEEIVVLKPSSKVQKKLDKELKGTGVTGPILTSAEIKELCNGGRLYVSLEPVVLDGYEVKEAVVTVIPNKPKTFDFRNDWSVTVLYGKTIGSNNLYGVGDIGVGRIEWEPLTIKGRINIHSEIGVLSIGGGSFGYAAAGARITF